MVKILIALVLVTLIWIGFISRPSKRVLEILRSGDGKTPKTAFMVYGMNEEYLVLDHLNMGSEIQLFSIIKGEGFDIFYDGNQKIYFKLTMKPKGEINL